MTGLVLQQKSKVEEGREIKEPAASGLQRVHPCPHQQQLQLQHLPAAGADLRPRYWSQLLGLLGLAGGVQRTAGVPADPAVRRSYDVQGGRGQSVLTQLLCGVVSLSSGSMLGRSDPVLAHSYSLPTMPSFSMTASLPVQVGPCSLRWQKVNVHHSPCPPRPPTTARTPVCCPPTPP